MQENLYLIRRKKQPQDAGRLVVASGLVEAIYRFWTQEFVCSVPSALEVAALVQAGVLPERLGGSAVPDPGPDAKPADPPF